jgi:hypothetical protein
MRKRRSPPQLGGEVLSYRTHGSTGAHLSGEMRSRGIGHVAAPEPTLAGRQSLELYGTWQHVGAHLATCLVLKPVREGTRFAGYRQWPLGPPQER